MTSSYFEQLGRQELAPFTNEGLDYEKTEPDLVEATNKEIDRTIEEQRRLFSLNISTYNQTMAARSDRLKNLEILTTKGKAIWDKRQEYLDNRKEYQQLVDVFKDPEKVANYATIEEKAETAQAELDHETQKELGVIDETGSDSTGVQYAGHELLELKQLIASQDFRNGTNVAKAMNLYLPMWMDLAKENLIVGGKLWADMSLTERQNWLDIAGAEFIAIFARAHPELKEGQLITHFMPTWTSTEESWLKQGFDLENAATEQVTSDSMKHNIYNGIIANTNADTDPNSTAIVSSPYTRNGWIDNRTAYYESRNIANARERANNDWTEIIVEGVKDGILKEEHIEWLLERHQFVPEQHKEGGQTTNYFGIKPENAARIYNAFNEKVETDNRALEELKKDEIIQRIKDGQEIPREVLNQFTNLDIRNDIEEELDRASIPYFDQPKFSTVKDKFYNLATVRAADPEAMGESNVQNPYWRGVKSADIYKQAGRYFHERYQYWLPIVGEEEAIKIASDEAEKALLDGEFDDATTIIGSTALAERIEGLTNIVTDTIGVENYINHSEILEGEENPLVNAERFLAGETNQLDPYWTVISQQYKNAGPLKVAHDRLVALGRIKPLPAFSGDLDLPIQNELLTNHNNPNKTLQAFLYPENVENMLTQLISPESTNNGGINAIQNKDGEWVTDLPLNKPLSEYTVLEVWDLVKEGYTNIGAYGFTNNALLQIFESNLKDIDWNANFDEQMQQDFLLARLYFKANNANIFANSVTNYRRLLSFDKEDREEYEAIIGDLPPFNKLNTLSSVAATEQIQNGL